MRDGVLDEREGEICWKSCSLQHCAVCCTVCHPAAHKYHKYPPLPLLLPFPCFSSLHTALPCCSVSTPASSAHKKKWSWQVLETQARDTRVVGIINELWLDNSWIFLDQINLHFRFFPNIYTSTAAIKFKLTGLSWFLANKRGRLESAKTNSCVVFWNWLEPAHFCTHGPDTHQPDLTNLWLVGRRSKTETEERSVSISALLF